MTTLSVVVITLNEERRIAGCLAAVAWADEIIVVDSGSSDDTVAIAHGQGARVITRPFTTYAEQKNAALAAATGDWILSLDADERVPPELAAELRAAIADPGDAVGFLILRREHMLGQWIDHGSWGPAYKLRLARRGRGRWRGAVHETLQVDGPTRRLHSPLLHETNYTIGDIVRKTNRYTTLEAQEAHAAGVRSSLWRMALYPPLLFLYSLIVRGGWRDGMAGFVLAALAAHYTFLKRAKLWEMSRSANS